MVIGIQRNLRRSQSLQRNLWRAGQSGLYAPVRTNFPIDDLELYFPLGHPELTGTSLTSKDLNALTGTVTGAVHTPPTHRLFDGTDDSITVPDTAVLNPDYISVGCWFKEVTFASTFNALISKWYDGTDRGYDLEVHEDGYAYWNVGTTAENTDHAVQGANSSVVTGTWYLAIGTYDGTTISLFVGSPTSAMASAGTPLSESSTVRTNTVQLGIGRDMRATPQSQNNANIGDAWIWSQGLTLVECEHIRLATLGRYV